MKTQAHNKSKITSFKLSDQVKRILHFNGLDKVFNFSEYEIFKTATAGAFNRPLAIANLFIEQYQDESDLNEYQF